MLLVAFHMFHEVLRHWSGYWQSMVELVIHRYTREAGVRNLERNLAALARAAAVKVAERDNAAAISKDIHQLSSPVLESRLAEGAEVEMEVIPIAVNNQDISSVLRLTSPLIVDETMLENVLGVSFSSLSLSFFALVGHPAGVFL